MKQEMLINVSQPEESRIAILEDGRLEELSIERASQESYVGNVYLGKIVNLEPSIQAAFVDFGVGRNGFLHISDVEPQYFRQGGFDPAEIMRQSDEDAERAASRARESGHGNRRAFYGAVGLALGVFAAELRPRGNFGGQDCFGCETRCRVERFGPEL